MNFTKALAFFGLGACMVSSTMHAALAADPYPVRPIELMVAYQAGGGTDNMARSIADAARNLLPQPIVVVNKPGASGSIGWAYVANGQPDGYRVAMITPELLVVPLMGIGKTTPQDFQPVARFTDDPSSITVRADAPWKSVEEFLAYAKANPGKATISNAGSGTIPHIAAAALGEKARATFNHVPYQGSAPAIMGLLSGDVDATAVAYAELRQHVEAGKLRTLAVMADKRVATLPNVPTFKERGMDLQYSVWRGIALPKSAPPDVVAKLREAAKKIAETPSFKETVQKQNLTMAYADMPEFSAAIVKQSDNFKKLMPTLKLKE
ncbi:tripartite tricarboxylate transporter substrate binding protein [Cupriavidus sp. AcVe19-6a]|uniref:tripartite tricarboxylate transporter substrate binding protein n=1 Tax=Cupriavidus sp. AcVe19-6a TaxID=2821358 RepID=UPI001AE619C0|nr:tripartite tricarboxylate transporter substrate binding protein [Cupriavidus sp. AcVe19-6a]MBP0639344.1 tripartite tricarboxylate transporter substrate binding protein [Cupriavidus sp. AcVe19-6a]